MERDRPQLAARLVRDERYTYRGYHTDGGVCRVRIYECDAQPPVFLVTALPENTNTPIGCMTEYLAAELLQRYDPARFEAERPLEWITQYSISEFERDRGMPEFARVAFDDFRPRIAWMGGIQRLKLGQPSWEYVDRSQVEALLGLRLDDPCSET